MDNKENVPANDLINKWSTDLCIAVLKKENQSAHVAAQFDHLLNTGNDKSLHGDFIGLRPEISRAGHILMGTYKDMVQYIKDTHGDFDKESWHFIFLANISRINK